MRLIAALCFPLMAIAQIEQANITGLVTDASGSAVPDALVTITNRATRIKAETRSNETGAYRIPFLAAGSYDLTVEKQGFDTATISQIRLTVGLTATINISMKTGSVRQEITVTAAAVQLEQQSSTLGNVVSHRQIVELPLLGRNPYNLVLLAPGVLPRGNTGSGPIINGGRSNTSEILLDGAETRNSTTNDIAYTPPLETVAEFKVLTNSFSSEFGRSGGGVLTVATRSGTNELHGSAYDFLRNDKLNANGWNSNRAGLRKSPFRRNEFGVSVGAPVYIPRVYDGRNKTFFFLNSERIPQRAPDNILVTVPTLLERQGDFSRTVTNQNQLIRVYDPATTVAAAAAGQFTRTPFPDNRIPSSRFDPIAVKTLDFYPAPNRDALVQNFVQNNTRANDSNKWFLRFDQAAGERHRLFLTLGWQKNTQFTPGINAAFPGEGVNGEQGKIGSRSKSAVLTDTYTIRPNLISQFRVSATRRIITTEPRSAGFDFTQLGFPASLKSRAKTLLFPRFGPSDVAALGPDRASYFTDAEGNYEGQAHLTWLRSNHAIKAGADYMFQYFNIFRPERPSGNYDFGRAFTQGPNPTASSATAGHGVATMLLGVPTGGSFTDDPSLATSQRYYAWYVQDDWRIHRRLTLNLGMRWEYQAPWTDRFDQLGYFDPGFADPLTKQKGLLRFTGRDGNSRLQTDPDRNNFAPRIGLAWQVESKTIVRAGYGLFYFPGSGGIGAGASDLGSGFLATTPVFLGPPVAAPNTPPPGASLSRAFASGFLDAPSTGVGAGIGTAF
ncbi:MAG: TonB-dependent receptor, partial [Acidobacteria bacterium]|nr:TonB-dependent receptor [Acidobacteriota bacterium]